MASKPQLTEDQKRRIEENRQKAIAIRAAKLTSTENASLSQAELMRIEENRKKALAIRANKQQTSPPAKIPPKPLAPNFYSNKNVPSFVNKITNHFTPTSNNPSSSSKPAPAVNLKPPVPATNLKPPVPATESSIVPASTSKQAPYVGQTLKATCTLISHDRFQVDIKYDSQVIEIFRTIPSKAYDLQTKLWNFKIEHMDELMKGLKQLQPKVQVSALPRYVVDLMKSIKVDKRKVDVDLSKIDRGLEAILMPFQREGVKFGIANEGKILLADEMGLGKTLQALAIASYFRDDWPLMIVTQASLKWSWYDAIETWLPSVSRNDVQVMNSTKDRAMKYTKILILTYETMTKRVHDLLEGGFKSVILDESHLIKNFKSARCKAALDLCKKAKRVLLLSGTPALSRPMELFTQLDALNCRLFPNHTQFGLRYCDGKKDAWGWNFRGCSNLGELQIILESTIFIRRMKADVLKQLPAKQRQMVILDTGGTGVNLSTSAGYSEILQFYNETAESKAVAICEHIEDLLESDRKFICFAHHKCVMDRICDTLKKKNVGYMRIDGSTESAARKDRCNMFQTEDECRVAVLSITSANTGLTLTACQLVVITELFWNPGVLVQAEDRAHRIGQEDSVLVQYLVAKGTIDDYLWPMIKRKLDVLNKAGLSDDTFENTDCTNAKGSKDRNQTTLDGFLNIPEIPVSQEDAECLDMENWSEEFFEEPANKQAKLD